MFCGGIGHSTINLKRKVAKILDVKPDQLPESEAEIYACLAKDKYQIESSSIFMDKTSTNTSENIKNAIQFLLSGNLAAIIAVLFCSIASLPVPFKPVHLLFSQKK